MIWLTLLPQIPPAENGWFMFVLTQSTWPGRVLLSGKASDKDYTDYRQHEITESGRGKSFNSVAVRINLLEMRRAKTLACISWGEIAAEMNWRRNGLTWSSSSDRHLRLVRLTVMKNIISSCAVSYCKYIGDWDFCLPLLFRSRLQLIHYAYNRWMLLLLVHTCSSVGVGALASISRPDMSHRQLTIRVYSKYAWCYLCIYLFLVPLPDFILLNAFVRSWLCLILVIDIDIKIQHIGTSGSSIAAPFSSVKCRKL